MSETALRRIGLGDPVSPGEVIIHHTEMVFNYGSAVRMFMYTSRVAKPGMRNKKMWRFLGFCGIILSSFP